MSDFFAVIGSIFLAIGIGSYYYFTTRGEAKPNPATILVWWVISIMNLGSYYTVVDGNYFKVAIAIVLSLGLTAVGSYSLIHGKFSKLAKADMISLGLAVIVGIFWQTTGDAVISNLMLQLIIVISFFPTIRGLVQGTGKERYTTWNLAVIAYLLQTLSITLDPEQSWVALVYPIINGIIGNGSVSITLFLVKRKK